MHLDFIKLHRIINSRRLLFFPALTPTIIWELCFFSLQLQLQFSYENRHIDGNTRMLICRMSLWEFGALMKFTGQMYTYNKHLILTSIVVHTMPMNERLGADWQSISALLWATERCCQHFESVSFSASEMSLSIRCVKIGVHTFDWLPYKT